MVAEHTPLFSLDLRPGPFLQNDFAAVLVIYQDVLVEFYDEIILFGRIVRHLQAYLVRSVDQGYTGMPDYRRERSHRFGADRWRKRGLRRNAHRIARADMGTERRISERVGHSFIYPDAVHKTSHNGPRSRLYASAAAVAGRHSMQSIGRVESRIKAQYPVGTHGLRHYHLAARDHRQQHNQQKNISSHQKLRVYDTVGRNISMEFLIIAGVPSG